MGGSRAQKMAEEVLDETVTILDVSPDSFAIILAHLGIRPSLSELLRLSSVCTGFRTILADEPTWQTLCKYAWSVDEVDLSPDWPRLGSFRALYAVLEVWVPRQGFFQLLDGFPWGCLLLLSFRAGRFLGEVIHHASPSSRERGCKCEAQHPVTVLEVDFPDSAAGVASNRADGATGLPPACMMEAARSPCIRWCGLRVASCTVETSPQVTPIENCTSRHVTSSPCRTALQPHRTAPPYHAPSHHPRCSLLASFLTSVISATPLWNAPSFPNGYNAAATSASGCPRRLLRPHLRRHRLPRRPQKVRWWAVAQRAVAWPKAALAA